MRVASLTVRMTIIMAATLLPAQFAAADLDVLWARPHSDIVWSVAYAPNGLYVASGANDSSVRIWDVLTGSPVALLTGHVHAVGGLAFSPDGTLLASSADNRDRTIKLWTVPGGALVNTLIGHGWAVDSVAFSPDGQLLASGGSSDLTARVWRVSDGAQLQILSGHTGDVEGVAFSPDGGLLAVASRDGTVIIYRVSDWQPVMQLFHGGWVFPVSFSPDGTLIASGSNNSTIKLWRVSDGSLVRTLIGHTGGITGALAFSPDGQMVLSGSNDGTVRFWRTVDGVPLGSFYAGGDVYDVAFSPGGCKFVYGGAAGQIVMARTPFGQSYRFDGFLPPINDPSGPESVFKRGSTVPVKFRLFDACGETLANAQANISLVLLGPSELAVNEGDFIAPADDGTLFRYDPGEHQYIYNLGTKGLAAGSRYRITATVAATGQTHSVTISLR